LIVKRSGWVVHVLQIRFKRRRTAPKVAKEAAMLTADYLAPRDLTA
jgi:uncharacterized NAD(P)/FAD-binding protein YdhS